MPENNFPPLTTEIINRIYNDAERLRAQLTGEPSEREEAAYVAGLTAGLRAAYLRLKRDYGTPGSLELIVAEALRHGIPEEEVTR